MKTRIKEVRTTLKLTQKQFGERLGVRQNTVAGWERGAKPSAAALKNICNEFGVSKTWLESGEGEMLDVNGTYNRAELKHLFPTLSAEAVALIQSIAALSPEHQKLLVQFISEGAESIRRAGGTEKMRELAEQFQKEERQTAG